VPHSALGCIRLHSCAFRQFRNGEPCNLQHGEDFETGIKNHRLQHGEDGEAEKKTDDEAKKKKKENRPVLLRLSP
jgi:hypothetical protein